MSKLAISVAQYDELVGLVYEGINETPPWFTFLSKLSDATQSRDASMVFTIRRPAPDYLLLTSNTAFNVPSDESTKQLLSLSVLLHTYQPEPKTLGESLDMNAFLASELYNTYLKPLNIKYILGQDIIFQGNLSAKLSVERTADKAEYGIADKHLFSMLAPHFRRAIRLREQMIKQDRLQEISYATLSKASIGTIMLNSEGTVVATNQMADAILAGNFGVAIVNGHFVAKNTNKNSVLKKLIVEALAHSTDDSTQHSGVGFNIEDTPGNPVLEMVIKPLNNHTYDGTDINPSVIIYINESKNALISLDVETLRNVYGMTGREALVSIHLAQGKTQAEVAECLNVSINTVKTHLRGVYEKLGVHSQPQVVAILSNSTARLV